MTQPFHLAHDIAALQLEDRQRECVNPERIHAIAAMDEPVAWKRARIAALTQNMEALVVAACDYDAPDGKAAIRAAVQVANAADAKVLRPGWMPPRPPRRMPTVLQIARYWADRDDFPAFDLDHPHCFGCRDAAPAWTGQHFERAHLVDRWAGGLDHAGNLVPLCRTCHRMMPAFGVDEGDKALGWVRTGGSTTVLRSIAAAETERQQWADFHCRLGNFRNTVLASKPPTARPTSTRSSPCSTPSAALTPTTPPTTATSTGRPPPGSPR